MQNTIWGRFPPRAFLCYRYTASQSTLNAYCVSCDSSMTAHGRSFFSLNQRDSWKRRSDVNLPLTVNYCVYLRIVPLFWLSKDWTNMQPVCLTVYPKFPGSFVAALLVTPRCRTGPWPDTCGSSPTCHSGGPVSIPWPVRVAFVVDRVALGQVSVRVLRFIVSVSFH